MRRRNLSQNDSSSGSKRAAEQITKSVYAQLRVLAKQFMRRERGDHTLEPTAIAHEAYVRLADQSQTEWKGKTHFLAIAAAMMRRVLVDHARQKKALKRGGHARRVSLGDAAGVLDDGEALDAQELERALTELFMINRRQGRVVELRFYGGLTIEDTARILGVSVRTVKEDWQIARHWLRARLSR